MSYGFLLAAILQCAKAGVSDRDPLGDTLFGRDRHRIVSHAFVLDAIDALSPITRPMFGCVAVYVGDRIVFVLRDKAESPIDNGVWLATTEEHHESLRREFPHMRSIYVFGKAVTGWQVLPVDAPDFEAAGPPGQRVGPR